jgi:integrase
MKGIFNLYPPVARYAKIWDPNIVLRLLQSWSPAKKIPLKKLTMKVLMLMLLTSGQRLDTVSKIDIRHLEFSDIEIVATIRDHIKQSRPGYVVPQLRFRKYPHNQHLCVLTYLVVYLNRTSSLRGDSSSLLLTFQRPHHPPTKNTLSRWVRYVLRSAGLDTGSFTSHSTRAASSSAAERGGATVEEILSTAGWASCKTFAKFYKKPILDKEALHFDRAVLNRFSVST